MILLVTASDRAQQCIAALHLATGEEVEVAASLGGATALLRSGCYLAVVLDQHLLETDPYEADTVLEHLDNAIPVQVNLAISGMDRLVREVRAALRRRECEELSARQAAIDKLHSELNGTVTALLLSSKLALESPGLPPGASEKLQSVHELVRKFRNQLESTAVKAETQRGQRT